MSPVTTLLRRVLNPRSVAVIGASDSTEKFGGRVMNFVVKHGFEGAVIPVNPSASTIRGIRAYAAIGDAPGPVDVALLAVPNAHIASAVEACGAAGVAACVVLTADFAELGNEGEARQNDLVQAAQRHGVRLIGPNCLGFINPALRLALTSSIALAIEPMPVGGIGLVSQSGSLMAALISHAQDVGTGFSAAISVGNQADLEICDFIEYFLEDPATHAICAYLEGLKDAPRFIALAARCRAARKPLLVVKAGQSDAGARITRSHTASLAGSDAAWTAACNDHAVTLLDDPEALIQCADFLIRFGPPRGDGIAALSPSGGTIAVTADRIAAAGLRLAQLGDATQRALHEIVPVSRPVNPLDVGGLAREAGLASAQTCYELLASDPDTAVMLIVVATTPQLEAKVRLWAELALAHGKPTAILLTPGTLIDGARTILRDLHCPFTNRMDDALRVIKAAVAYGAALDTPLPVPVEPADFGNIAAFTAPAPELTETETKQLLALASISVTTDRLVRSVNDAVTAARTAGYPVVLKLSSRTLTHKSDVGGVVLGLENEEQVRRAFADIGRRLDERGLRSQMDGVTVQPMVADGVEAIVGMTQDPSFGPVLMFGLGGVYVELLRDVTFNVAPVTDKDVREMVGSVRGSKLLEGWRGAPAADRAALETAILRLSQVVGEVPEIAELDLNPLKVLPAGRGCVVVDARIAVRRG
jgi:acetyl-CoA synthetase (ADP-forming)